MKHDTTSRHARREARAETLRRKSVRQTKYAEIPTTFEELMK